MAYGVSCVVTNVGDSAWLVGDTDIVVVVPPSNPDALKTALMSEIAAIQPKQSAKNNARQRIVDQFSVQQLALKTQAALLEVS